MVKKYSLENLDCQNCANKMEENLKKLEGVSDATINFFTQKVSIDWDDAPDEAQIQAVKDVISKVEPSCRIVL